MLLFLNSNKILLGKNPKIPNPGRNDPRCPALAVAALDKLLQVQGPQPAPGDAQEAAVDVHVVLQRATGADPGGAPAAQHARRGQDLLGRVPEAAAGGEGQVQVSV